MASKDYIDMARKALREQKYLDALGLYDKAILQHSSNSDLVSEKGVVLFHLNKLKESLHWMDQAVKMDPKNPYRYSSRAFIKDANGLTKEAIEDYELCIALDPEDAVAYNNLGLLQEKLGRKLSAEKNFKKADELSQILEKNNISYSEITEQNTPVNIQKEINLDKNDLEQKGVFGIMKSVFTEKEMRKEFLAFIKGGLKKKSEP